MAQLIPLTKLAISDLHAVYPFALRPTVALPQFFFQMGASANDHAGVVINRTAACLTLEPLFVPHHNTLLKNSPCLPSVAWDQPLEQTNCLLTEESTAIPNLSHLPGFVELVAQCAPGRPSHSARLRINARAKARGSSRWKGWQGLTAFITRDYRAFGHIDDPDDTSLHPLTTFSFKVGKRWFIIVLEVGGHPRLVSTDAQLIADRKQLERTDPPGAEDTSTLVKYGDTETAVLHDFKAVGDESAYLGTPASTPVSINIALLNGVLSVSLGGGLMPLTVSVTEKDSDGALARLITEVGLECTNFNGVRWSIHPTKWSRQGWILGNPGEDFGYVRDPSKQTISFTLRAPQNLLNGASRKPQTVRKGVVFPLTFPDQNFSVRVDTYKEIGTTHRWVARLKGDIEGKFRGREYTDFTPCLQSITTNLPPVVVKRTAPSVVHRFRAWSEDMVFDQETLTVHVSGSATLNNFKRERAGQMGNRAVSIRTGYHATPPKGSPPTLARLGLVQRSRGFSYMYDYARPSSAISTMTFHYSGYERQLAETDALQIPVMDGWNHYYAVAWLLEYVGITRKQLRFADMVPTDPFESTVADISPYFLALGEAINPRLRIADGTPILGVVNSIQRMTGFVFYFDANGKANYAPFVPERPGPYKKTFNERDGPNANDLLGMWNLHVRSDTTPVRNEIAFIGIDQTGGSWLPLVGRYIDDASVDSPWNSLPANYIGWRKRFVWSDARFADNSFVQDSVKRAAKVLRLPNLSVDFQCAVHPDLFPLDVIGVTEHKTGLTAGKAFVVTSTSIRQGVPLVSGGPIQTSMSVSARWLGLR